MFHKLKQKASLARVNIFGDSSTKINKNNSRYDIVPRRRSRSFQSIYERPGLNYVSINSHSGISIQQSSTSTQPSEVEALRIELSREVRKKQDALSRLRRADTRRLEATNRAERLDRQFELSSREVGRLQIELQRKHDEHQLEKQAILHQNAELRTQNAQFIRHVADIENKRTEDFERFKKKN